MHGEERSQILALLLKGVKSKQLLIQQKARYVAQPFDAQSIADVLGEAAQGFFLKSQFGVVSVVLLKIGL
ncbi:hypothetical protein D3C77_698730 [compost metagenome]